MAKRFAVALEKTCINSFWDDSTKLGLFTQFAFGGKRPAHTEIDLHPFNFERQVIMIYKHWNSFIVNNFNNIQMPENLKNTALSQRKVLGESNVQVSLFLCRCIRT